MALKPNPMLAQLAKAGVQSPDDIVPLIGLVVSADAGTVTLRSGLMAPETISVNAGDVLYSEQAHEGGVALVIVGPDAPVTITTTAVALQRFDGSGSGSGDDPVKSCVDGKVQACIKSKMLEGKSKEDATKVCDSPTMRSVYAALCRNRPGSSFGGVFIL